MSQNLQQLIRLLEEESAVYEDLLGLSRSKTQIIVQNKVNDLENITRMEQSLVLRLSKLEDEREQRAEALAKEMGTDPGTLSLSMLIRLQSENSGTADQLRRIQTRLGALTREIQDVNNGNAKLLKNSIEYIDFSLNLMTSVSQGNNQYGQDAQLADGGKRRLFDVKL